MVRTQIDDEELVRMHMAPTVDEFRRYLQARRNELQNIVNELKKEILKIAAQYKEIEDKENFKPYKYYKKKKAN